MDAKSLVIWHSTNFRFCHQDEHVSVKTLIFKVLDIEAHTAVFLCVTTAWATTSATSSATTTRFHAYHIVFVLV